MRTFQRINELRQVLNDYRRSGQRIALVPTMGNLHEGHLALVAAARQHADITVASIFVNPMQFGPGEDLDAYPRTLDEDRRKLNEAGCDLLFTPAATDLYPRGLELQTSVHVPEVSAGLCGASRPGHFEGVATVVTLLFNLVQPDVACFGEKDYQQLAVIRKLVDDLHFPIEIVGVPIARAEDGLALSSRNGYLSETERARAPALYRTLQEMRASLEGGAAPDQAIRTALAQLSEHGFKPDYLELRRAHDLKPVDSATVEAIILAAAHLGPARLLDNLTVTLPR
ncbi:pantoate--beta-alanine ligase [Halomonas sp. WWR20]